ncbi:MAG: MBL fold metallo-hydrolase [Crenarchaeota archaeon]|nr:MBL fold metallo-hydrolase [Thermoproteota archaeon]
MEIKLLAFDSFGVRSMSTFIQTRDTIIHIDPAVSLAPKRYNLPPHRREVERLIECAREIEKHARDAEIIIITHYHYDHHDPGKLIPIEIYKNKVVYVKDPNNKINRSQMQRASRFLSLIKNLAKEIKIAERQEIKIGNTCIKMSDAVPHGVNDRLGYVVEVSIWDGEKKLLYTSDVEGPPLEEQVKFILDERPDILILDGPMTYMLGFRYSKKALEASISNIKKIIDSGVKTIVIDHHFMRDLKYRERLADAYKYSEEKGVKMISAAEFMNRPIEMLEAMRDKLYQEENAPGVIPENIKEILEE